MFRELRFAWTEFKAFIDSRGKSIQWFDRIKFYHLIAFDGQLSVECFITKTNPASAEQTEFETGYMVTGNQPPTSTIVRRLSQDNITVNPRTIVFDNQGTFDKQLVSTTGLMSLRGGTLYSELASWNHGDSIGFHVIDKDDVLGLGGTIEVPIFLSSFIPDGEWSIMPNCPNTLLDESLSTPLPNGLYMRLNVFKGAGGLKTPKGVLNILAYEV